MCLLPKVIRFSHKRFPTWDEDIAILKLTSPIDIINVPTRSALLWVPGFFPRAEGLRESSASANGRSLEKNAAQC